MTTGSRRTSFFDVTADHEGDIHRVEVPHFQRDYAQGRDGRDVERIRLDFLDVLYSAIGGDDPHDVGLDFVYGGIDEGTFRPLDGQQRLTTLFLIHWYMASRSGHLNEDHGWKRFSYATRQSARMFCERLVGAPLPEGETSPSDWIADQAWYLFVWRHDPTIQSMLVMIDAIHRRFRDVDATIAWERLTDFDDPAVWFLLLPLSELGGSDTEEVRPEDLYIKMNSRGKPLTEFENFKAQFENTIQSSPRAEEFALKVDTTWSDLLWHLRGDDSLIDDEFLRYLEFITEICEWREGRDDGAGLRLGLRTVAIFGEENPQHHAHLNFLIEALDVWMEHSSWETFETLFTSGQKQDATKTRLFFRSADSEATLDLFEGCCRSYGESRGRARVFSLGQSLLLYAVLLHLIESTDEFPRRVRVLRNLIEASSDELRLDRMPKILEDVHSVIRNGAIDDVGTLNQAQVHDEQLKAGFLDQHPTLTEALFNLEDHELLRGSLGAFELDAGTFEVRATTFRLLMSQPDLWPNLLAALLAVGEYHRQRPNARPFIFGTDSKRHDNAWRELLTGATSDWLEPTRTVLAEFLDRVGSSPADLDDTLASIANDYLAHCEQDERFDWRYYMVKYPAMRENGSSTYFAERLDGSEKLTMGFSLCMLRAGGKALSGYYRDPYLLAIARELGERAGVQDAWFTGYETEPRRLPLTRSEASIRCIPAGFELKPPPLSSDVAVFDDVCADLGMGADNVISVPQVHIDGRALDTVDRVNLGTEIVRRLVDAGL
jgi:hypothetical protein